MASQVPQYKKWWKQNLTVDFCATSSFFVFPLHVKNGYTASKTKHDLIQPPSVSRFAGKGTALGRQDMASSVRAHWLSLKTVGFKNGNGRYRTVPDGRITTVARNRRVKQNRNVGEGQTAFSRAYTGKIGCGTGLDSNRRLTAWVPRFKGEQMRFLASVGLQEVACCRVCAV